MVGTRSGKLSIRIFSMYILFVVAIPCLMPSAMALFYIIRNFPLLTMEDAKTIMDSYWRDYCKMKKDRIGQA